MFDIGMTELLLIGVVALIVIGPERLPRVARTAGHLFGRLQRYVNDVKADINREMELDELRKLRTQVQDAARDIERSVSSASREVESNVRDAERELNTAAAGGPAASEASLDFVEPAPGRKSSDAPSSAGGEPGAPGGAAPAGPAAAVPRQGSLPGLDAG